MNGVVIPAIERRFRLASQKSGLILGSYDIAAASLVIPISYLGERAHKPRWLGLGCLLLGIGALVFTLPHVRSGGCSDVVLWSKAYGSPCSLPVFLTLHSHMLV